MFVIINIHANICCACETEEFVQCACAIDEYAQSMCLTCLILVQRIQRRCTLEEMSWTESTPTTASPVPSSSGSVATDTASPVPSSSGSVATDTASPVPSSSGSVTTDTASPVPSSSGSVTTDTLVSVPTSSGSVTIETQQPRLDAAEYPPQDVTFTVGPSSETAQAGEEEDSEQVTTTSPQSEKELAAKFHKIWHD